MTVGTMYRLLRDRKEVLRRDIDDLHFAACLASQELLCLPKGELATVSVADQSDRVVAVATNRRIIGSFKKQEWGGRKGDYAIHVGEESFDATESVLGLSVDQIHSIDDDCDSSDEIGRHHVDWSGPCTVVIVRSICDFFGVTELEDITPEALSHCRRDRQITVHDGGEQTGPAQTNLRAPSAP